MTLRTRLVVGAAAAVAVAIVIASIAVYFLVGNDLRGQVDQTLQADANSIRCQPPSVSLRYAAHVYQLFCTVPPAVGYYQLVDGAGNVYIPADYLGNAAAYRNGTAPIIPATPRTEAVADGHPKSEAGAFYYDTALQGVSQRVLTLPTETSGVSGHPKDEQYAIQVVASLAGVDNELARIRLWLILGALGGVAIASGAAFFVARSALRPVRDLSETAERVRMTRDLSQRITVQGHDELSQLASTFNAMLAALDDAASRQQQLVQDASHELRTPLTSLRTNIEVLADGGELPPEDRDQLLHDVIEQLGELTDLVSELTVLARGEEQDAAREEVRLDLVAEDAIRRTVRNYPEISVTTDLSPTTVVGSAAGLERAIGNLLDNAAKWSPPDAPIEVTLRDGELTVRDHGPGVTADDAPHIFDRFYRATAARSMPGSGLGLAIVRRVAEAHGGMVSVEAAAGGGTLMRLRLPTPTDSASSLSPPAGSPEQTPSPPDRRVGGFAGRRTRSASERGGAESRGRRLRGSRSDDKS